MNSKSSNAFTLFALAKEYEALSELERAIQYYDQLEKNFPENTGFYYHYAQVMQVNNNLEEFKRIIKKGIEVCKKAGDTHALAELLGLYNQYIEDDE
ncbi:MAG: tetratricopeptide repeat protein [Bacteroidota bacterium]